MVGLSLIVAAVAAYLLFMARFERLGASRANLAMAGAVLTVVAVESAGDNPLHHLPSMFVVALLLATAWRCASEERAASAPHVPVAADQEGIA